MPLATTPGDRDPRQPSSPPAPVPVPAVPLWLQRFYLAVRVILCIEMGLLLAWLPWSHWWEENSLLAVWPALGALLQHNFVRGAVSGLGLLDVWIGLGEALRYRESGPQEPGV